MNSTRTDIRMAMALQIKSTNQALLKRPTDPSWQLLAHSDGAILAQTSVPLDGTYCVDIQDITHHEMTRDTEADRGIEAGV